MHHRMSCRKAFPNCPNWRSHDLFRIYLILAVYPSCCPPRPAPVFDQAFQTPTPGAATEEPVAWQPAVEARESVEHFTFELDLPGVNPDTVEVLAAEGTLTVRGTRPARDTVDGERTIIRERSAGRFA